MKTSRIEFMRGCTCLAVAAFLVGNISAAHADLVNYMVALSPDGSRVAVAKSERRPMYELFEGPIQQPLRPVNSPTGLYSSGEFVYAPDGKDLLFVATASSQAGVVPSGTSREEAQRITTIESMWRLPLSGNASATKMFEAAAITNALPLLDGSIAFMGAVSRLKSYSSSPLFSGDRVWTSYRWMLRKPDGAITNINSKDYAFFSAASLIRDGAVFVIQERRVDRQRLKPPEFYLDITELRPGIEMSELERHAKTQDSKDGPRLQCDWAGKTCLRLMTYNKNQYFAHRAEIIRDGKVCTVEGLPDRTEHFSISRNGKAIALITRPNPYRDAGYQLAHAVIDVNGCASRLHFITLP